MMTKSESRIHFLPKLHVKRCCPAGNKMGCELWRVMDSQGTGLGKFGTRTGAMDFALGRANARALQAYRDNPGADIDAEVEIEED